MSVSCPRLLRSTVWVLSLTVATPVAAAGRPRLLTPEPNDTTPSPVRLLEVDVSAASTVLASIEADGAQLLAHLPDGALLVAGASHHLLSTPRFLGSYAWTPEQAISPDLLHVLTLKPPSQTVPIVAWFAPGTDVEVVAGRLASAGAQPSWIEHHRRGSQIGLVPRGDQAAAVLETLSTAPGLVWADVQPPVRLHNADSSWRCQSGDAGAHPIFDRGITGEGQIIGILDTGIDIDSCFFHDPEHGLPALNDGHGTAVDLRQRKVLAVDFLWDLDWPDPDPFSWDDSSHGSHVAGSAAGDQPPSGVHDGNDGMAPAARLVIQDAGAAVDVCADLPGLGCPLRPLEPVLAQAHAQGARLHSNSWGDEEEILPYGRYTERTADVDRFVWEHKDFLVFVAAGNDGPGPGTVGSPSTAKNAVAVGATGHGDLHPPCVVSFSSRGPSRDGRVKPDVVVPGQYVVSATSDFRIDTSNCGAHALSGTSMASPTAAGLAALVRQYFEHGYYPTGAANPHHALSPSAALVKATLIASAVDLTRLGCTRVTPIPSRDQGWGLVQLDRALFFADAPVGSLLVRDRHDGFRAPSDPPRVTSLTPSSGDLLKVVLVWTDYPSTAAATVNLVNDLDLTVDGPDGHYLGNVIGGGASLPGGLPDRFNNVEVVLVERPTPGRWQVTVTPHTIAHGPQDYALVVTGAQHSFVPHHRAGEASIE